MLVERFDVFLFDLDGVVYLGDEPLPHARESLARLRSAGKAVLFLTNDPRPTRSEVARRLARLGIEARQQEIFASGWATARCLKQSDVRSAYVVGSPGLISEIREAGVEVIESGHPEAVVIGGDERTSYAHIERAVRLILGGARFVATNPDSSYPTPEGPIPGAGAVVAAIQAASNKRPAVTVGKPYPEMFDLALEEFEDKTGRIVMVGDNPSTDILGAHRVGITGILVSRTPVRFRSNQDFRIPDAVIPDLSFLFDPRVSVRAWKSPSFSWPDRVEAGVAAVILNRKNEVLLVRRVDRDLWSVPSGGIERGESIKEAVSRNVIEETGLKVAATRLIGVYSDPASQVFCYPAREAVQFITCCFLCVIEGEILQAVDTEASGAAFFNPEKLPAGLLPTHSKWLSDTLAGREPPFIR
ncbi:MAG: HAD-IIA family hydrolase [Rubrobacter sp.]|nr:HAD-IIA family hydrolase [Rubrobacter sp.]